LKGEFAMAKKSTKSPTLDETARVILSLLLTEFRAKGLGMEELGNTYQGLSPTALKSTCCADGRISDVDFDLAMSDLDNADLVKTGPMEMYDNPPGSSVVVIGFYSKNEYSYLTEQGYKAATRLGIARPPGMSVPRVHISGGTFHQSPIGIGDQVAQTVNISASSDELFNRLREEIQERISDDKKRSDIIVQLDALEDAKDKPSRLERYTQLVGVIGDHVTVFGPLLTLLLQRLMGAG
jgi:hypothetical protein